MHIDIQHGRIIVFSIKQVNTCKLCSPSEKKKCQWRQGKKLTHGWLSGFKIIILMYTDILLVIKRYPEHSCLLELNRLVHVGMLLSDNFVFFLKEFLKYGGCCTQTIHNTCILFVTMLSNTVHRILCLSTALCDKHVNPMSGLYIVRTC